MVSCLQTVAVTLLLLSFVDVWKLELGLAPYSITVAVGALTLAVVIQKLWVAQRSMLDTNTDGKYKKLESPLQSKLHLDKEEETIDSMDIFTLPQYIHVIVLNYQLPQTIFAIPKSECCTHETETDEQFSPVVTIVDAVTNQPLDCVLLLHGEKPPEVNCRTLFCYIAVQVTVVPNRDAHNSHPLHHMESKPCKQGTLPLTFCFHQPGIMCVIKLSVHSIADSEGVEYIHHSDSCTCFVQVVDRKQRDCYPTAQHGAVRTNEPPLLKYTCPLATKRFHKLERLFTKLFLSACYDQIHQLTKLIVVEKSISPDIKVFALCWDAVSVSVYGNNEEAEKLFKAAWKKASKLECENGLLLQGRVLRHLAHFQYCLGNDDKAWTYISRAKTSFYNAAPSNETAFTLHTELRMQRRTLFNIDKPFSNERYTIIEEEYKLLLEHANYVEDYEKPVFCNFFALKASFHLRSDLITDKLPPKEYWPSPDDLSKAEDCLKRVSLDIMPSTANFHAARYYRSLCDLYIWKQKYSEAKQYLEKAQAIYDEMEFTSKIDNFEQQFKLLERLNKDEQIDEKIDKILEKFSDMF